MMKAPRSVKLTDLTLSGEIKPIHMLLTGGGAHTWENIVFPLLQVKILFLAHTLLVQGACLRETMLLP